MEVNFRIMEGIIRNMEGIIRNMEGIIRNMEGIFRDMEGIFRNMEGISATRRESFATRRESFATRRESFADCRESFPVLFLPCPEFRIAELRPLLYCFFSLPRRPTGAAAKLAYHSGPTASGGTPLDTPSSTRYTTA
jgi:hypothetical protein